MVGAPPGPYLPPAQEVKYGKEGIMYIENYVPGGGAKIQAMKAKRYYISLVTREGYSHEQAKEMVNQGRLKPYTRAVENWRRELARANGKIWGGARVGSGPAKGSKYKCSNAQQNVQMHPENVQMHPENKCSNAQQNVQMHGSISYNNANNKEIIDNKENKEHELELRGAFEQNNQQGHGISVPLEILQKLDELERKMHYDIGLLKYLVEIGKPYHRDGDNARERILQRRKELNDIYLTCPAARFLPYVDRTIMHL